MKKITDYTKEELDKINADWYKFVKKHNAKYFKTGEEE